MASTAINDDISRQDTAIVVTSNSQLETKDDRMTSNGYNPRKGVPYVLLDQLFKCLSLTCAKYIFESHPKMSPFQFLYVRAVLAGALNIIMINKELKQVMCTSVGSANRGKLAARVCVANLGVFVNYSCIKYFPLTYCTAVRNTAPFFTLILSAQSLKEPPTVHQVAILVAVVALVMAFVFTGSSQEETEASGSELSYGAGVMIFAWVCLLTSPLLNSVASILGRVLRDLDERTLSVYSTLSQFVIFLAAVLIAGQDCTIFTEFNAYDWIAFLGCSLCLILAQRFNFLASKNLPNPARLPLNVTGMLFQIVIDILLFSMVFSGVQVWLILAILAIKIYEIAFFYCIEIPRAQQQAEDDFKEPLNLEEAQEERSNYRQA